MCIAHASKLKCLLIYLTTVPVCSISSKHVWRKFMSLLNIFMFQFTMQYFLFQNNVSIQVAHFLNGASVFVNNELLILFDQLFFSFIYTIIKTKRERDKAFLRSIQITMFLLFVVVRTVDQARLFDYGPYSRTSRHPKMVKGLV